MADRPVGQFAIAGASLGELTPVVLLSLFFSGRTTTITSKLLLYLTLLASLPLSLVIGTLRIERSMWITRMIDKLADTSAQIRIRLSMLLVVGLGALATRLGFEAIAGASSLGDPWPGGPGSETQAPAVPPETRCHRLRIPRPGLLRHRRTHIQPVGAVLERLYRAAGQLFHLALLVVADCRRPLPVRPRRRPECSRRRGCSERRRCPSSSPPPPSGFRCTPSGRPTRLHSSPQRLQRHPFPFISLQLLRSSAKGPDMVPEQAHARR